MAHRPPIDSIETGGDAKTRQPPVLDALEAIQVRGISLR
jgi:hypothetical protein